MPNNLVVSGNLTINGTATYVNTESISSKDPLFEVANTNNTTDAVDIGYYGRYYDAVQERVEFTGLFRDASDAGKFKIFTGLVDEPTNVVNTTGTGYTVATLVANVDGNLAGTANAANILSTARTIAASGDAAWSVSFDGSANVTSALTLANTGVTATTYGTSTAVPTIAVDSKGRITSASNTNITFPVTTVNGQAGTVVLTTSDVAEGTNQYFTTAKAQASITGGASSVVTANLTASRALVSDGSGKIAASATTTTTEIGYLAGVTSAIQTQIDSKLSTATAASTYLTISNAASTYLALSGGTLTGPLSGTTGTFSGILTTPQVKAATSAGLSINANSGTQVADFGAGGSANITFFGGLAGTSATFSSTVGITGALTGTSATFSGLVTATSGSTLFKEGFIVKATTTSAGGSQPAYTYYTAAGSKRWSHFLNVGDDKFNIANAANSEVFTLTQAGAATFSNDVFLANSSSLRLLGGSLRILNSANSATYGYILSSSAWKGSGNNNPSIAADSGLGINFFTNGSTTEAMTITSGGNVGIGTTIDGGFRAHIKGGGGVLISSGSSNSNNALYVQNEAENSVYFRVRGDGYIYAPQVYVNTTGSAANVHVTSGGDLIRSTSSLKYKKEVKDYDKGLAQVMSMRPVYYKGKGENDGDTQFAGLIAEEVHDLGLTEFVQYAEDGTPDALAYQNMIALAFKAIQELKAEIDELKAK
jgi:hypothetical protein